MQQWQGPLPPPAALDQFNQIIPDGAHRILSMVEQEQAARIKYEQTRLDGAISDNRLGQWFGITLSLACVAGAVYVQIIGGSAMVSVALVSLPIMAAVRAFLRKK